MASIHLEMDTALTSRLAALAKHRQLSPAEVIELAVTEFVEREEFQRQEIEAALAEASSGDFASDAEVAAVFQKYAASHSAK